MAAQYSFVMKGLNKTYPGAQKPTLKDLSLQFYPDAKIGIVGPNGTGKSTLMKIMAGIDKEFTGEACPFPPSAHRNRRRRAGRPSAC